MSIGTANSAEFAPIVKSCIRYSSTVYIPQVRSHTSTHLRTCTALRVVRTSCYLLNLVFFLTDTIVKHWYQCDSSRPTPAHVQNEARIAPQFKIESSFFMILLIAILWSRARWSTVCCNRSVCERSSSISDCVPSVPDGRANDAAAGAGAGAGGDGAREIPPPSPTSSLTSSRSINAPSGRTPYATLVGRIS
jgi:hypothetical protein